MSAPVAEHFQDHATQAHAARLGILVFLVSESLLFAGLFGLWAAGYAAHGAAFTAGAQHNHMLLGTLNTVILLCSSGMVAMAVTRLGDDAPRTAAWLLRGAVACGAVFLAVKSVEYTLHLREGLLPGGAGSYFRSHPDPGLMYAVTLYWLVTGLHALHVLGGMAWLWIAGRRCAVGAWRAEQDHLLECAGYYWHMVDILWIIIWPLFYLIGQGS